ncbi:MAG: hypothetical protein AAFO04_21805 [Cyanobacteria bacterium J06592_8]
MEFMENINQCFQELKTCIERNKNVYDSFFSLKKASKSFNKKKNEKNHQIKIPEVILDFFGKTNGFSFNWKAIIDGKTVTGESRILSGNLFFEKKVNAFEKGGVYANFWSDKIQSVDREKLKQFFVLDDIGYSNYVIFEFKNDLEQPELYLYMHSGEFYKLNFSFEEYIAKTIEYGGIYLWQRYYCTEYKPTAFDLDDRCFEYAQILLPDADLVALREKSFDLPLINESKNYYNLFSEQVHNFEQNRKASREIFALQPGAPVGSLVKAQVTLRKKLPEEFINFFYQLNGVTYEWSMEDVHGCINVGSIERIMGGKDGALKKEWYQPDDFFEITWFDEESDNIDYYKRLRPLEEWFGTSAYSALDFESKSLDIFLNDEGGEFFIVPISFISYIDFLLVLMGLDNWLYLFIEESESPIDDTFIKEAVQKVFPEVDIDGLL